MKKDIAIFTTHHLDSNYKVGSYHIYNYLKKKGCAIDYYSAPISLFHYLRFHDPDTKIRIQNSSNYKSSNIIPFALFPPIPMLPFNSTFVIKNWYKFSNLNFKSYSSIIIDNIFYFSYVKKLKYRQLIFRINDYYPNLPGWNNKTIRPLVEDIKSKADHILYTSQNLRTLAESNTDCSVEYLPNGVSHFTQSNVDNNFKQLSKIQSIKDKGKKIILYAGATDKWFSLDFIHHCAKNIPNAYFLIIGKVINKISKFKNIIWLGEQPYNTTRHIMSLADVGIIPFQNKEYDELIKGINPIKFYEYLYHGLSVVSVPLEALNELKTKIYFAANKIDFCLQIKQALQERNADTIRKSTSYVKGFSWDNILNQKLMPLLEGNT